MQSIIYVCMLLISWFGAQFIVAGSLTTGQLTSLLTYTMQILMSLMMLSMIFVMITISRASAERIVEVLDEQPDLPPAPQPRAPCQGRLGSRSRAWASGTRRLRTGSP